MALSRLLPQAELIVITTPQLMAQKVATRVADMAKRSFIPLLGVIENMSYFESNTGEKFNIFGEGEGEALSDKFGIPLLGKIPIGENTNDIADGGTPLINQENNSVTKVEIEKLINNIAIKLPPIIDETCTGRLAKVFEELSNQFNPVSVNELTESVNSNLPRDVKSHIAKIFLLKKKILRLLKIYSPNL